MIGILLLGIFILVIGVMLLVAPHKMYELNNFMNRSVFSDKAAFSHRYVMAILCILVGGALIYVYAHYVMMLT
jgi:hypothetical protein